jgi:hypothetical protein
MTQIVEQARMAMIKSINLNRNEFDMFKFQTKNDPLDIPPMIDDPDNVGEKIIDPEYVIKTIPDYSAPMIIRGKIWGRIAISGNTLTPQQINSGIGVINAGYLMTDYNNKIFELDQFLFNEKYYSLGPVDEIKTSNEIIGYRSQITMVIK